MKIKSIAQRNTEEGTENHRENSLRYSASLRLCGLHSKARSAKAKFNHEA
jgi:hypothetical protein